MTITGGIIEPSDERRQHSTRGGYRIDEVVLQDERGDRSIPWRAEGLLAQLERRGDIDNAMRQAGELFHHKFQRASLDPLRAADLGRVGGCGASSQNHGSERARSQVNEAMKMLGGMGSPQGSCAWIVLGCDYSIRQWAARENWRSRPIDEKVAKGIMIATLAQLAQHWGLT